MDGAGFSQPRSTVSSPNLYNATQSSPTPHRREKSQPHHRLTPIRPPPTITNVLRNTSISETVSQTTSTQHDNEQSPSLISPTTNLHLAPPPQDPTAWSSAIGRATLGKSGRVIEKLMADVDRLKRELNAELSRRQEIEKREEASRSRIEALLTENANLVQVKEMDAATLRRRERKIEELGKEVEGEKEGRRRAQEAAAEAVRERDEVVERSERERREARDRVMQAESHASVLEQSYVELEKDYRERTETARDDLNALVVKREEEQTKVKKLDVVVDQMRHELDHANKMNEQMVELFAAYKESTAERIQDLEQEKESWGRSDKALREETERVLKEAKWLVNVGRTFGGVDGKRT